MQLGESHQPADAEHVNAPTAAEAAGEALKRGPVGALIISLLGVGLLFVGWMLFYFLLFMGRGPVG